MSGAETLATFLHSLGVPTPRDSMLYLRAFTHGSTGEADYQRLEFLGDRVLGLTVAEMLYRHFPDEPEGRLSHRLNALVNRQSCADVARQLALGAHIRLGKQARDDGAMESDNVLGDVMEALIGAIYLDHGHDTARSFVERLWTPMLKGHKSAPKHPKSALQEWAAAHKKRTPEYAITGKSGPAHAMQFEVTVTIKGLPPVSATGSSKQEAETRAATQFLENLP